MCVARLAQSLDQAGALGALGAEVTGQAPLAAIAREPAVALAGTCPRLGACPVTDTVATAGVADRPIAGVAARTEVAVGTHVAAGAGKVGLARPAVRSREAVIARAQPRLRRPIAGTTRHVTLAVAEARLVAQPRDNAGTRLAVWPEVPRFGQAELAVGAVAAKRAAYRHGLHQLLRSRRARVTTHEVQRAVVCSSPSVRYLEAERVTVL